MRHRNLTICLIAALAVLRVLYIVYGPFDVSPDEAHYWEWSRRLDLSYYSKGPGVAYVIAFFTSILGPTELGVRLGAFEGFILPDHHDRNMVEQNGPCAHIAGRKRGIDHALLVIFDLEAPGVFQAIHFRM